MNFQISDEIDISTHEMNNLDILYSKDNTKYPEKSYFNTFVSFTSISIDNQNKLEKLKVVHECLS